MDTLQYFNRLTTHTRRPTMDASTWGKVKAITYQDLAMKHG
jgi:hypothetical protein